MFLSTHLPIYLPRSVIACSPIPLTNHHIRSLHDDSTS